MSIAVEVVDAPLEYKLLLGWNSIYTTKVTVSSIIHLIFFPFENLISTINHMSFDSSISTTSSGSNILTFDNYQSATENVGVGMYP